MTDNGGIGKRNISTNSVTQIDDKRFGKRDGHIVLAAYAGVFVSLPQTMHLPL